MKKVLAIGFILTAICSETVMADQFGGMDPGVMNTQYMREMRRYDVKTRTPNKSAIIQSNKTEQEKKEAEPLPAVEVTANIQSVQFVGNNAFPSSQLNNVIKNKLNEPMTAENLAAIRKSIMRFYQMNGYYSAVAMIVSQNNKTGEAVIEIQEGTRNSITFE